MARIQFLLRGSNTADFDPDDVWGETLLSAWRDRHHFRGTTAEQFRAWLLGIARNLVHNGIDCRKAARRGGTMRRWQIHGGLAHRVQGGIPLEVEPIRTTTPSRFVSGKERAAMIVRAVERLSPDLREVVIARIFEDLDTAAAAQRLGIGVSAVKHRLRKGLEALIWATGPALGESTEWEKRNS
jgi:RNA polymerase sigma factor (sigma-70 family)